MAVQWAADGHGIVLRSLWDVRPIWRPASAQVLAGGAGGEYLGRLSDAAGALGQGAGCVEFLQALPGGGGGPAGAGAKLLSDEQLAVAVLQA
jgi:hypothetical protein